VRASALVRDRGLSNSLDGLCCDIAASNHPKFNHDLARDVLQSFVSNETTLRQVQYVGRIPSLPQIEFLNELVIHKFESMTSIGASKVKKWWEQTMLHAQNAQGFASLLQCKTFSQRQILCDLAPKITR